MNLLNSATTTGMVSFVVFIGCFIAMPTLLFMLRQFGLYVIVEERRCLVYVLFGKVRLVLTEPGLHFPIQSLGWRAFLVNFFGDVHEIDLRLDQEYLRSQAVNSEEGAPMGIGVWYEMWISDPVSYLFKNADPRGSLRANVGNATVRNLSNMKLSNMLEDRHTMSGLVRDEVSDKSKEWGYSLGSVYIRKVHFRDGNNQVNLIASTAEAQAAVEFGKAAAMRPSIVGQALHVISQDEEVAQIMFEILENQKMLEGKVNVTLIPPDLRGDGLTQFLTAGMTQESVPKTKQAPPLGQTAPVVSSGAG
jgi:regulator of protease activity HflC (stomatin/prohibitin superfamily)